jgi:hypothetical protein
LEASDGLIGSPTEERMDLFQGPFSRRTKPRRHKWCRGFDVSERETGLEPATFSLEVNRRPFRPARTSAETLTSAGIRGRMLVSALVGAGGRWCALALILALQFLQFFLCALIQDPIACTSFRVTVARRGAGGDRHQGEPDR